MVLTLLNRKAVKPEDFVKRKRSSDGSRPVEMKPAVCRALIDAFERLMAHRVYYPAGGENTSLRQIMYSQARAFAASLEEGAETYRPFLLPY